MDFWNIFIPIFSSVLGGAVGGLFTFFGVKMTIKHENKDKYAIIKMHIGCCIGIN